MAGSDNKIIRVTSFTHFLSKLYTKLQGYVSTQRTINNKALSADIELSATDVGAMPIYKSLAEIGCSTANTLQEIFTALPAGAVLNIDWCGNVENTGTTFGNALPGNYGSLTLYKTGESNCMGKFEFWEWYNGTKVLIPHEKFVTYIANTWRELEWSKQTDEVISGKNGNIVFDSTFYTVYNNMSFKIGNLVVFQMRLYGKGEWASGFTVGTAAEGFRPSSKIYCNGMALSIDTDGTIATCGTTYNAQVYTAMAIYIADG